LLRLAAWLKERKVESVAMESTGVYWIAPHELLEGQGLAVLLADTRHLAQVPGRDKKSDPSDCEWLQKMHSCGLLKGAFRPKAPSVEAILTRWLGRSVYAADLGARQSQSGGRGWAIGSGAAEEPGPDECALASGGLGSGWGDGDGDFAGDCERRARSRKTGATAGPHCHNSQEEIAEQLRGHWRADHLFSLKQGLKMYDEVAERITAYDEDILRRLAGMQQPETAGGGTVPPVKNPKKAQAIRKEGQEPMRAALYRMSGVDLTSIDAIGVGTVQVVLSEYGADLSRFEKEQNFVSHLRLAPYKPTSGGKPLKKKKRSSASTRVAAALRMAATSLRKSQTALGAYYRHISRRIGADVTVFATARKLATLIYRLLRWGQPYVDEGAAAYERRYEQNRLLSLKSRAHQLGYELVQTG
jgi:hypothetical protein